MVWALGIPMAFLGAFVFDLPVYWVMLMINSEEALKVVIGFFRMRSKKWIHNLVQTPESIPTG
jgi:Na+-driven multidrug efflux pump